MILDSQSITVNQIINPSPDQDRQIDDPRGLPFFFLIPAIQQQQKYNPNPTTPRTVSFFSLFHYSKRFYHAHWLISTSTSYLGFFFGGGLGIFFFFWTTLFFFFFDPSIDPISHSHFSHSWFLFSSTSALLLLYSLIRTLYPTQ